MSDAEPFWTVTSLAGRIGVSIVTLRRWKRTRQLPAWAIILIGVLSGELEAIDRAFAGWIIRSGELVSPEGWRFSPGEIRSIPFLHGQVRTWRSEALELRAVIAANPQYSLQLEEALEEPGPAAVYSLRKASVSG